MRPIIVCLICLLCLACSEDVDDQEPAPQAQCVDVLSAWCDLDCRQGTGMPRCPAPTEQDAYLGQVCQGVEPVDQAEVDACLGVLASDRACIDLDLDGPAECRQLISAWLP